MWNALKTIKTATHCAAPLRCALRRRQTLPVPRAHAAAARVSCEASRLRTYPSSATATHRSRTRERAKRARVRSNQESVSENGSLQHRGLRSRALPENFLLAGGQGLAAHEVVGSLDCPHLSLAGAACLTASIMTDVFPEPET